MDFAHTADDPAVSVCWRPLVAAVAIGILLRLGLAVWFDGTPLHIGDAVEYNSIAVNLAERGEFASTPGSLTSIRPPLYPAMLALVYRVLGRENHAAVRVIQAVLGLLTAAVVYLLAREMYDSQVAAWAAAAVCLYPSLLFMGSLLLSEVLFTFLLCLACLLMQRYLTSGLIGPLFAFGLILGLAALTRSVLWLFPPLVWLFLLWAAGPASTDARPSLRSRLIVAFVPVFAFCLAISPWSIRNTRLQQTFTTIDVMGGRNFMMGNYEHTPMFRAWDAISVRGEQAWYRILAREHPDFPGLTQGQKDKLAMKRGAQFVLAHPGLTVGRDLVKFLDFWQLERTVAAGFARGWWGGLPQPLILLIAVVVAGSYAVAMLLGIVGYCMLPPRDMSMHVFLLLLAAFVCGIHTLVFGHERYHVPLMPLVLIYAAAAASHWRQIWERRTEYRFVFAAGLCMLLSAGWVFGVAVVEWEKLRQQLL